MKTKKLIAGLTILLALTTTIFAKAKKNDKNSNKLKVVTTIFPEYDWTREILGTNASNVELTLLLGNGVDLHSYQPSIQDIAKISTADIFIYVGGESDGWVKDALKNAKNKNMKVINLLETLGDKVKAEEVKEGMQAEEEEEHEHHHHDGDHDHEDHDHHEAEEHHHHHHDDDDDDEHEHHHHHDHDDDDEHEHHHHNHDDDDDDHEHEHHHHDHEHEHHHHHADEVFDSIGFETSKRFTKEQIENALKALDDTEKYGMILRSKGIVAGEDGTWIHFDFVPEEVEVRTGASDVTGKIVVIGAEVKKDAIKELFGI